MDVTSLLAIVMSLETGKMDGGMRLPVPVIAVMKQKSVLTGEEGRGYCMNRSSKLTVDSTPTI